MRVISNPAFDEDTAEAVDADAHLLKRIEQGDLTAMKTLYEAHSAAIHRFVRSRIRDEFEASDIVHETMLSVWRGAAGFQNRSTVLSWMLTLARNKTVDHLRKQSRVTLAEPDETIAGDDPDVETVLTAAEDAKRLRACVEDLPDRQRAVVHLAFFEDMTCAEISTVEGIPEGTVKTRIYHAKKLLMRCLSRCGKKV